MGKGWAAAWAVWTTRPTLPIITGATARSEWNRRIALRVLAGRWSTGNLALQDALIFYLDFVNLFLMLLRIFGNRR